MRFERDSRGGPSASRPSRGNRGVRVVAALEASKAAVVLIAGFGLLSAVHLGAAQVAEDLARQMHLNPAKGTPHIFIDLARDTSSGQLRLLAAGAFAYAAMRSAEAFGLWRQRRWAVWFSVASGAVYVPIELYEISQGFSAVKFVTLLVNLGIVACMAHTLRASRAITG